MKTRTKTRTIPKTPFFAAFSVGAVLFSAHAGGGFATGNQANTYYVGLGWAGIVSAIVAMLLLTLTMREAMIMYNSRGLTSYKQLFETLYHPFDKIEWLFEIFFYIMVLMAVAAAISGAASALRSYFGVNYYLGVVAVGCLVLLLTIFGAGIVRAASTYMGIAILVTASPFTPSAFSRASRRCSRCSPRTSGRPALPMSPKRSLTPSPMPASSASRSRP